MELRFIISRSANLFMFVQRGKTLQPGLGELREYFGGKENVEVLFFGENKKTTMCRWLEVIERGKRDEFKKTFNKANTLFAFQWKKTEKHLQKWKRYFKKNKKIMLEVLSCIEKVNGLKRFDYENVPIYFISIPGNNEKDLGAWFSWTAKERFIVFEIPEGLEVAKDYFPVSVLVHEFFHLMMRKNQKDFSVLIDIAKKNKTLLAGKAQGMPHRMFFEELLVSSFIPEGYINERFLKIPVEKKNTKKPEDLLDWRRYAAIEMREVVKKHIDGREKIKESYLKKLIKEIKNAPLS